MAHFKAKFKGSDAKASPCFRPNVTEMHQTDLGFV